MLTPSEPRPLTDVLQGIPHEVITYNHNAMIAFPTIDSRRVSKNALFICIKGLNTDGHRYIMEAAGAGAAAILIEDKDAAAHYLQNTPPGAVHPAIVYVESTRKAMGLLAANFYDHPAKKMRLIGVTGTNGKSTTTHFIENILRAAGRVTGLIGTVGVHVNGEELPVTFATSTTPDPLELHPLFALMLKKGVQDVVMEVSSHALALYKMEGLVFDVGVFTNLTQDHLDFHGTMENYHDAKAELFRISKAAVANADDPSTPTMLKHFRGNACLYYTLQSETAAKGALLRASRIQATPQGMSFDVAFNAAPQPFTLPMLGRFNVANALAAVGTAHLLGLSMTDIRRSTAQIHPVPGRFQTIPNKHGLLVIVDYAHTPDGLENTLTSLREIMSPPSKGRIITLFGCGGDRDKEKRPRMGRIAAALSDYCILTSDNPRTEPPTQIIRDIEAGVKETATPYEIIESRGEAIRAGVGLLNKGDALLIAGKGHEDYQIIGIVKHPFDDTKEARSALEAR